MALRGINGCSFSPDALTLPADNNAIIAASPKGGLRVNISHVEGVLDEAWGRVRRARNPEMAARILSDLEFEMGEAMSRQVKCGNGLPSYLDASPHSGGRPSRGLSPKEP